jgi:hypothetical protein
MIHRDAYAKRRTGNGLTMVKVVSLRIKVLTNSLSTFDFSSARDAREVLSMSVSSAVHQHLCAEQFEDRQ